MFITNSNECDILSKILHSVKLIAKYGIMRNGPEFKSGNETYEQL